jgi:formylmethanofuran dehydrogenase subunit E
MYLGKYVFLGMILMTRLEAKDCLNRLSGSIPSQLLDEAIKFHGHLGAFLVLGIKAGIFANEMLKKDCFETSVVVKTHPFPPFSCFVDGIQITTGCTMGKGNIHLEKGDVLKAKITKGNHQLNLSLKVDVFRQLIKLTSKEESKQIALNMVKIPIQDLFDINKLE